MDTGELFKSFAEPIRLRLLHLLSNRGPELCVCDLVAVLCAPQGTVSRHLTHLRLVGLVQDRREGVWVYYRLAPAKSKAHAALLDCLRACFDDDPVLVADLERYAALARSNSLACCAPQPLQGRVQPPSTTRAKVKVS